MKFTGHAEAKLPLQRSVRGVEAWISPNVLYRVQGEFQQLNLGCYVSKGPLVGGIGTVDSSPKTPVTPSSCWWVWKPA